MNSNEQEFEGEIPLNEVTGTYLYAAVIEDYIEDIDIINDSEENCEIQSNLSPNLVEFIGKDASKLKVLPVGWEAPKVIHSYLLLLLL